MVDLSAAAQEEQVIADPPIGSQTAPPATPGQGTNSEAVIAGRESQPVAILLTGPPNSAVATLRPVPAVNPHPGAQVAVSQPDLLVVASILSGPLEGKAAIIDPQDACHLGEPDCNVSSPIPPSSNRPLAHQLSMEPEDEGSAVIYIS